LADNHGGPWHGQAALRRRRDPGELPVRGDENRHGRRGAHVYERAGEVRYGEVEVGQETVIFE